MKRVQSLLNHKLLNYFNKYARSYARYIAGETTISLDQSTLTGRLINYLKNEKTEVNEKTEHFNSKEILCSLRKGTWNLGTLPSNTLINIIRTLENQDLVKSNAEFYRILRVVDEGCCFHYQNLNATEILDLLDAYMNLLPNRITDLKFYNNAVNYLFSISDKLKGKDYMRYIFHIALMKKCLKSQKMLRQTLSLLKNEDINDLSCEDLCIIANSTFKTSTKIPNKNILYKIKNYLNDNLMLLKDPAIFVTLTKTLRHNRFYDEDLLASISCAIFFNKAFEFYTFQTYCHLLALYSDNLYYDEKLLKFLTMKCLEELKFDSADKIGSARIRAKDIVRFLWGISNLNCKYLTKEDIKSIIIPKIIENIHYSKLSLNQLIDVFMYLWISNYKCYELVPFLLEHKNILEQIPDKNSRQRLNQLLICIFHEDRQLYKKIGIIPQGSNDFVLSQHLKNRPCLQEVVRSLETIGPKMNIKFKVGYQIPYMNILGIIGYEKNMYKSVNIEVLDHFTTLKNTDSQPSGLMQMKLRILDGSEEALIVIKENDIEYLTEAEREEFLQEELDLVC
ncbi:hypothetical protein HHI36_001924 [Cryptolaemus montrouzieri]|uniref:Uncharacterized protein n=1 Tax=Cryptolaemus montrouzieri TaxID=559131 RepID=A0ABD2P9Q0_9CUCU